MAENMIRKGGSGDQVSGLQQKLNQLGYSVKSDGIFGDETESAVRELQTAFGYDVDGIVGPATSNLIDQQIGYGWNKSAPDAFQKAQKAQGKGGDGAKMQDGGKVQQAGAMGGADKFGRNPQQQAPQGKGGNMPPEKQMGGAPQKGAAPATKAPAKK